MKTLAVVRAIVFAVLLVYSLYAMPWAYLVLPKEGVSLALVDVVAAVKSLAVAVWLGVAWIGVDAYLSFALLRKAGGATARAAGAGEVAGPSRMGVGPRSLFYRLRCLLKRREVDVWYDPAYRLPLTGIEFSGLDPRRADFAAWWLRESKAIASPWWRNPRRASYAELARVHEAGLLESMSRPETLAAVFGVDPSDVPVDEVMRTVRLATGATIQAAGEALRRGKPQLNLLGGFHHASPTAAGGNCAVNDIAVAIAVGARRRLHREGRRARPRRPPARRRRRLPGQTIPNHWIGSISGSDWGPLPGVDETVLPEGTGNDRYLEALMSLLGRMPPAGLVFVIAGGDVLRGDRLGKLDLTLGGTRRRNVAVAAHLEGVPSVWLPGGGYSKNAWKTLAGAGIALSTGSLEPIPDDYDPLSQRFAGISAGLTRELLSDSGELTEDDLAEALSMRPQRQKLLLGFYTAAGMEYALQRYGVLDQLRRLGYDHFRVEFARQNPGERIRVYGESRREGARPPRAGARAQARGRAPGPLRSLAVADAPARPFQPAAAAPPRPGGPRPGAGPRDRRDARPHGAPSRPRRRGLPAGALPHRLRRPSPLLASWTRRARGGSRRSIRDLRSLPLLEATRAVDEGRVMLDGTPYAWEPDEMVLWLREHPEERGEASLELDRAHFTLGPAPKAPPSPPAGPSPVLVGEPRP